MPIRLFIKPDQGSFVTILFTHPPTSLKGGSACTKGVIFSGGGRSVGGSLLTFLRYKILQNMKESK